MVERILKHLDALVLSAAAGPGYISQFSSRLLLRGGLLVGCSHSAFCALLRFCSWDMIKVSENNI